MEAIQKAVNRRAAENIWQKAINCVSVYAWNDLKCFELRNWIESTRNYKTDHHLIIKDSKIKHTKHQQMNYQHSQEPHANSWQLCLTSCNKIRNRMDNKNSCCAWRSGSGRRRNLDGNNGNNSKQFYRGDQDSCSYHRDLGSTGRGDHNGLEREESGANLQHISEREPDDIDRDPSVHPSATTLFIERSKRAIQSKSRAQLSFCWQVLKLNWRHLYFLQMGWFAKRAWTRSMNRVHWRRVHHAPQYFLMIPLFLNQTWRIHLSVSP